MSFQMKNSVCVYYYWVMIYGINYGDFDCSGFSDSFEN